jgi:aspartyl-tRNA(Asn)/glutamyl-tRNA(Gln) amidotransferase subunit A
MIDVNVLQQDLTEQISLVKAKQLSADELNQQQLSFIQKVNPYVNAFISVNNELATSSATTNTSVSNSKFMGVSIAIKDNINVQGFNTTAGLEIYRHNKPTTNAYVVQQLQNAGAVFSGKLNMHEGALGASNQNAHYGNCFNPHQLSQTPGGSSGGSGAAVASCMTPLALGTDTMGSVRIPASYCGVFGFKPSKGLVSNRGTVTCSRIMDTVGPIARSARDLTLALNIMAGFDSLDANSQQISLAADLPAKPVLLVPENLEVLGIDESIIDDFHQNLDAFIGMGCTIQTFDISHYNFGAARRAGLIICEAEMRVEHEHHWVNDNEKFSPYLKQLLSYIDRKSPMDVIKSERILDRALIQAREIFSKGDFILMPTTLQRAFSFNDPVPANQADLTSLANQAGLASVSIPMISQNLLPAGMQIVGRNGSDFQLLSLAEKWQQHTEFSYKLPQVIHNLLKAK